MEFQRAPLVEPQSHGCCRSWMGDIQRLGHRAGSRGAAIGGRLAALPPGPVVGVAGRREAGLPVHGPGPLYPWLRMDGPRLLGITGGDGPGGSGLTERIVANDEIGKV